MARRNHHQRLRGQLLLHRSIQTCHHRAMGTLRGEWFRVHGIQRIRYISLIDPILFLQNNEANQIDIPNRPLLRRLRRDPHPCLWRSTSLRIRHSTVQQRARVLHDIMDSIRVRVSDSIAADKSGKHFGFLLRGLGVLDCGGELLC